MNWITTKTSEKKMKQFEVGKAYGMNSPCDQDCWWYYLVTKRTATSVTLVQVSRDKKRMDLAKVCRINKMLTGVYNAEAVRPLGSYSMCPTLTAEKVIKELSIK